MISSSYYLVTDHTNSQACPDCGTYAFRHEGTCTSCTLEFDKVFLPDFVATFSADQLLNDQNEKASTTKNNNVSDRVSDIFDVEEVYEQYVADEISQVYQLGQIPHISETLCCNQSPEKCSCKESVSFSIGHAYYEDQFLYTSGLSVNESLYFSKIGNKILCGSCQHFGKYSCKPLRAALRMAYDNPSLLEYYPSYLDLVDPCSEYEPTTFADEKDVAEVMVHIKNMSDYSYDQEDEMDRLYGDIKGHKYFNSYNDTYWD